MTNDLVLLAQQIKLKAAQHLPGIDAHKYLVPENRLYDKDYLKHLSNYKHSAVFALMFYENNNVYLLLTQRHNYKGSHGGQISFPGGKKENQDQSLLNTAYRETLEETGIKSNDIELITALSPLYIPVSNFYVQPFLGYLPNIPNLKIDTHEVASVLRFPINNFLKPDAIVSKQIEVANGLKIRIPAFELDDKIIWGATAMIMNEIAHLVKFS